MHATLDDAYNAVDWKRIHAYMTLINWTWCDVVPPDVPDVHALQVTVSSLMRSVRDSELDNTVASTGGFSVNKWIFDSEVCYEIIFDIA